MVDQLTSKSRSENMRRIRSKDTGPEWIVRRTVHAMGYRYRLHVSGLPGKPDLVFPRLKRIIEVRGCFWHQHEGCLDSHIPKSRVEYWEPKLLKNKKRDLENLKQLKALGWKVLVVWECRTRRLSQLEDRLRTFLSEL